MGFDTKRSSMAWMTWGTWMFTDHGNENLYIQYTHVYLMVYPCFPKYFGHLSDKSGNTHWLFYSLLWTPWPIEIDDKFMTYQFIVFFNKHRCGKAMGNLSTFMVVSFDIYVRLP